MKRALALALLVSCSGCETLRRDIAADPEAAGAGGTGGGPVLERTGGLAGSAGTLARVTGGSAGAAGANGGESNTGGVPGTGGIPDRTGGMPATGGVELSGSFLEEGTFSRLTAQISDDFTVLGRGGTCGDDNLFTVDSRSRRLSWDFCRGRIAGEEPLSEAEFQGVINTASLVTPSPRESCGGDWGPVSLDAVDENGLALYQDDYYAACFAGSPGRTFVGGTSDLLHYLNNLTTPTGDLPEVVDSVRIQLSNPISDPNNSSALANCQEAVLGTIIQVVMDRRTVERSRCLGSEAEGYTLEYTTRPLTMAEYEQVRDAYAVLEIGASGPCSSLSPGSEIHRVSVDGYSPVADESASCIEGGSYGLFAVGVEQLYAILLGFAP